MSEIAQNNQEPSSGNSTLEPTGMRTFLIVWIGQVISIVGSRLTNFGLGVWIFEQTGDAMPFALTVLFGSLPSVFLLPVAGSLADRWNRRWLMILADTGNGDSESAGQQWRDALQPVREETPDVVPLPQEETKERPE